MAASHERVIACTTQNDLETINKRNLSQCKAHVIATRDAVQASTTARVGDVPEAVIVPSTLHGAPPISNVVPF